MAKKNTAPKLQNWAEADEALRLIGERRIRIEAQEAYLKECVNKLTKDINDRCMPLLDEIKLLEQQVRAFTNAHRKDFGDSKSRDLVYGTVRYRASTKILGVPRDGERLAELIAHMRAARMSGAIITVPDKVDKDELRNYDAALLQSVGLTKQTSDTWGYELKIDKVKAVSKG